LTRRPKRSILHQRLAVSTCWWCGPRPSREVGRNGETTTPRGPTIRSPSIVWNSFFRLLFLTSGPNLGAWPDCWVSVEFFHASIPRKGSGSTTTTTTKRSICCFLDGETWQVNEQNTNCIQLHTVYPLSYYNR